MNLSGEPTLIVPDVHLRLENLKAILNQWGGRGRVIFLGDFFDDFGDTATQNAEMASFLKKEVLGKKSHTVIMGNHDFHYHPRCPDELKCSGFTEEKKTAIGEVLSLEDFSNFQWATHEKGFLLTHAGLHPRLLSPFAEVRADKISQWINDTCRKALDLGDIYEPLLRAGYMRYGAQPVGGVIWMDVREYEHIPQLRQIFGHTPLRVHSKVGPVDECSFCIDTNLDCVGLVGSGDNDVKMEIVPFSPVIDFDKMCENLKRTKLSSAVKAKIPGPKPGRLDRSPSPRVKN